MEDRRETRFDFFICLTPCRRRISLRNGHFTYPKNVCEVPQFGNTLNGVHEPFFNTTHHICHKPLNLFIFIGESANARGRRKSSPAKPPQ
jgi:hypothetical protein